MANYQSGFTGAQIDAAVGGAVRFDVEQSKTNAEKAQARSNAGAVGIDEVNRLTESIIPLSKTINIYDEKNFSVVQDTDHYPEQR